MIKIKTFLLLVFVFIYFIPNAEIRDIILTTVSYLWFVFTIAYAIYIYYTKDREYEVSFKSKYCEVLPSNKAPEIIGFLLSYDVKRDAFISVIMELIRKKSVLIGRSTKSKEYFLINNKDDRNYLSRTETYVKKWLFKNTGDGEMVSVSAIRKEATHNSGYFYSCYKEWVDLVSFECTKFAFFENKKNLLEQVLLFFFISYLLVIYNVFLLDKYIMAFMIFSFTTLFLIYVNSFYKRSRESNREYEEWMAFKRYIKNPDNSLADLSVDTLATYAVYSKVLGTYKELKSIIAKKYSKNKEEVESNILLYSIHLGIMDDIDKIIENGIKFSVIANILFARNHGNSTMRKLNSSAENIKPINKL